MILIASLHNQFRIQIYEPYYFFNRIHNKFRLFVILINSCFAADKTYLMTIDQVVAEADKIPVATVLTP